MKRYSDLADSILGDHYLLQKLRPTEVSDTAKLLRVRAANDAEISDARPVASPPMFSLVRAGLLYALDAIDESHRIIQAVDGDESAYCHGMVHRREGDFYNARYWFSRAGTLSSFGSIHRAASAVSSVVAAQANWDPYLFTGLCEQERFGDTEMRGELVKLQRIEFEVLFDYLWRRSFNLK